MSLKLRHILFGAAASALLAGPALAEKIIIGHFGNPTPSQLLSTTDELAQATGWEIEWRKFGAGTDVIAAMASGDVVLSELGSSPIAIAASSGVEIEMIAYAGVLGKAESLIARNGSNIASVADLKG
ncbi:MAG: taurine ABC transporter substrate-binding protein, partial [Tabrizicola sp.]